MKVSVQSTSGRPLGDYQLPASATLSSLQPLFHAAHPLYYPDRQRFYPSPAAPSATRPPALNPDSPLSDADVLLFKDLGPQILWKTVFLLEYLGPLLLYPLFYNQPRWIYGDAIHAAVTPWAREVQFSALMAWTFHYAKRELETLFVHRFSHATMPLSNLFKNSIYYWGFAAYVAYFVNHPLYTPPKEDLVYTGMCLFYFMEVGNLSAHWTLRMLRPPGTKVRRIPRGGLFELVSCPNYTYEILSWLGFNMMTKTIAGLLFMCAGAFQMLVWAGSKHRRYKKEFDGKDGRALYPPSRKILIPFLY
ncbi:trans-2-enoyl-CoA reductase (NADPH) [Chondrus crispus]|uniref:Trans-2-enoyl-CoA reductase (NADPH) n=1 Tax=Chondrus crispus TaxID=2769 RepID=R7Q6X5_CHOCR|nr:trans-2-enoyl-CoA reductase (NADPH) [Chondrus crispus]CDF33568.1 trans-2-enoyl-CoA reductase (NADPH) [Chondrus crispus]|eukprot:XP_005713371.1 trans-2-enoyl-CoA reductase (NADPH) [Chondrus crispus]